MSSLTRPKPIPELLHMGRLTSIALVGLLPFAAACDHGVTEPVVPDAVVLPEIAATLATGDSVALTASYVVGGATGPSDDRLRWRSTQPNYFSIDSLTGRGLAHNTYSTGAVPVLVVADAGGAEDTTTVLVVPSVARVGLTVSRSVALGRSFRVVVLAWEGGEGAHPWPYAPPPEAGTVVLRSSDPRVISVESNGTLVGRAEGTAWVAATLRGRSDSLEVTVRPGYALSYLEGTDGVTILDVNDAGQVAGTVLVSGGFGATQGVLVAVGSRSDLPCRPNDINNAGQIACGGSAIARYENGSTSAPPGGPAGNATGITEGGVVFGGANGGATAPTCNRYLLWEGDTVRTYTVDGQCVLSTGKANNLGHGVGLTSHQYNRPILLRPGASIDLSPPGGRYGEANAINDADDVVGSSENQSSLGTAAIWRASEQWQGHILGLRTRVAWGIAENGLVAGDGDDGAFVWQNNRYALLSDLVAEAGWTITSAKAISRGGLIAAQGIHVSGKRGIVLITPTAAP